MARLPIATVTPTTTVAMSQQPRTVSDTPAPGLFAVSTSSSDLSNSGSALMSGSTSISSPTPTDAPLDRVIESEARDKIIIYIIIGVIASLIGLALLYIVHRKFKKVRARRMRTTSRLCYRNLTSPSKETIGSPTATPASVHSLCDMQAMGVAASGVRSMEDPVDAEEGELTPTPGNVPGHADWPREAVTAAPLVEAQMLSHHSRFLVIAPFQSVQDDIVDSSPITRLSELETIVALVVVGRLLRAGLFSAGHSRSIISSHSNHIKQSMVAPTLAFVVLAACSVLGHPTLPTNYERDIDYARDLDLISRDLEAVTSFYNLINARGYADKLNEYDLEGRNYEDVQVREYDDTERDILYA
ncbi:hypothetical protein EYR40_006000 [Pleurotus pulmonarius]|nr:hypothetical protein EYR36_005616 [Pleurotus pulmonarius]KAF4602783.1 hypothetical protein EYR40_006000 [Pleurotus pulmonarius]